MNSYSSIGRCPSANCTQSGSKCQVFPVNDCASGRYAAYDFKIMSYRIFLGTVSLQCGLKPPRCVGEPSEKRVRDGCVGFESSLFDSFRKILDFTLKRFPRAEFLDVQHWINFIVPVTSKRNGTLGS